MAVQLKLRGEALDTSTVMSVPEPGERIQIRFGMQLLGLSGNITSTWRTGRRSLPKLRRQKRGPKPERTNSGPKEKNTGNVGKQNVSPSTENVVYKKSLTVGDIFEDAELRLVSRICQSTSYGECHQRILDEVVFPALSRINNRTMQENDASYLAYVLEAVCTTNTFERYHESLTGS